jgi:hypothetical protein
VTDADAHTVELRALMSAADASIAWDLRCHVRERLIAYLREHHPGALPKARARIEPGGTPAPGDEVIPVSGQAEA